VLFRSGLLAVDYGQTLGATQSEYYQGNNTWTAGHDEMNPLLGRHPSKVRMGEYFIGSALLALGIAYLLPEKYRAPFQHLFIGFEGAAVARNFSVGAKLEF